MTINLQAIEQLATDQASLKAAAGLTKPAKWSNIGISDDAALIWGECAGSGANPYRVMGDLRDFGNKCTCPSRKFPCKHVLALFWLKAEALAPFPAAATPDWVTEWLGRRRTGGNGAPRPPAGDAGPPVPKDVQAARLADPEPVEDAKASARREAAAARRSDDTNQAIAAALDALDQWIADQLRLGLAGLIDDLAARCRRISARLVDGKAAALASHVDELPAELLALPAGDRVRGTAVALGRLVLLARAWRADPARPDVRRAIASAEPREALLADPATLRATTRVEVLAEQIHSRRDGLVVQTTWLLNLGDGPRFAMLLDHYPASTGRRGSVFTPGEQFAAELAWYPAALPVRAVLVRRDAALADGPPLPWPAASADLANSLTAPWLAEPWASRHPVLLPAGRIGLDEAGAAWWRAQDGETCLPLAGEATGLILGTSLDQAAALWSGHRLQLLAARSGWGRISHG